MLQEFAGGWQIARGRLVVFMSISMRKFVLAAVVLFVQALFCSSPAPAAAALQGLQVGMEGPDFSLQKSGKAAQTFANLKGEKLTVLVFWSTWSKKAEKILARMQKLHEKYRDKGLVIIGINVDQQEVTEKTLADIAALYEKLKLTFPTYPDQNLAIFHDYGVIAVPTTVVMDGQRVIVYELSGWPLVGAETLVDFIVAHIEGKQAALAVVKSGYQPGKSAQRLFNMGKTTLKSKRMADAAETWFKKAIEADPKFVLPRLSLAGIYLRRGDAVLAQGEFREVLAREPANPVALCESGLILVNAGKESEGTALFDAARKGEESYPPCYYYAGYAYSRDGKLDEALKMFDEAERINPLDYNLYVYKGMALEALKEKRKSYDAYKKALELVLHLN